MTGARRGLLTAALLLALLGVAALSLFTGSAEIPAPAVLSALGGSGDSATLAIVRELRLPRLLLGLLVGGALALSGASLQALLGNPLADPYLLGVSGGAACGTLAALVAGAGSHGALAALPPSLVLPVSAFAGALAAVVLVGLGATVRGHLDRGRLLLSGVVVNALASAVLLILLSISDAAGSRGFVFWMLGSLSGATPESVRALAVYAAIGLAVLLPLARAFDALTLGEETAFTLGVAVERAKRIAYVAASLLAAAAVAYAGIIGFVGLIVPQVARRLVRGHRSLLLASFAGGALLLVSADVLSRTLFAPREVAVGAVTALIGAPAFLVLLRRRA